MITTVLFDFDGTLIDTTDVVISSWQDTFRAITGEEKTREELLGTLGEVVRDSMKRFFPDRDPDECIRIYRSFQGEDYMLRMKFYDGMEETVRRLKREGYKVGIVTSRTKRTAYQAIDNCGLRDCFDYVLSCEDTDIHKPNPEPALLALEKLGSSADETIMIGDSMYDIGCAHNAGITAAAVSWQTAIPDDILYGPEGPEYIIDKAEDIFRIIEECNG